MASGTCDSENCIAFDAPHLSCLTFDDLSHISHTVGIQDLRQRRCNAVAVRGKLFDKDGEIADEDLAESLRFNKVVALEANLRMQLKVYVESMRSLTATYITLTLLTFAQAAIC